MAEPVVVVGIDEPVPRRADIGVEIGIDLLCQLQIVLASRGLVGIEHHFELLGLAPAALAEGLSAIAHRLHGLLDVVVHHLLAHLPREDILGRHLDESPLLRLVVGRFSQLDHAAAGGSGGRDEQVHRVILDLVDASILVHRHEHPSQGSAARLAQVSTGFGLGGGYRLARV